MANKSKECVLYMMTVVHGLHTNSMVILMPKSKDVKNNRQ